MSGSPTPTLYDLLLVRSDATTQDVRNAYRRLAQEHHPDRAQGADPEAMTRINQAYEILSDPDQRARYDQQLLAFRKPRRSGWVAMLQSRGGLVTAVAVAATVVLAAGAWTVLRPGPPPPPRKSDAAPLPGPATATAAVEAPLLLIPSRSMDSWGTRPQPAESANTAVSADSRAKP